MLFSNPIGLATSAVKASRSFAASPSSRDLQSVTSGISAAAQRAAGSLSDTSARTAASSSDMIRDVQRIAAQNTATSSAEAERLRKWQEQQNALAMQFNASEAAKNRDWQKMMSDTAHQREIKDLQAAGLNPVLSAMGGQGASVGSGATASGVTSSGAKGDVDMTASSGLVSLLGTLLQTSTTLQAQAMSARSNEAIADKTNAMNELIARITGDYGLERSRISARSAAQIESMREAHDTFIHQNYPNNNLQAIIAALSTLFGGQGVSGVVSGVSDGVSGIVNSVKDSSSKLGSRLHDLLFMSNKDYDSKYHSRSGKGAGRK